MLRYNEMTGLFEEVDDTVSSVSQVESLIVSPANKEKGAFSSIYECAIQGIAFFVVSWLCVVSVCLITGFYVTPFNRLIVSGVLAFAVTVIMRIANKHINFLS